MSTAASSMSVMCPRVLGRYDFDRERLEHCLFCARLPSVTGRLRERPCRNGDLRRVGEKPKTARLRRKHPAESCFEVPFGATPIWAGNEAPMTASRTLSER